MKLEELKAQFAKVYYKGVNEALTPEQDEVLRAEFLDLESTLMGLMDEEDFLSFYDGVHHAAWGTHSSGYN